MGSVIQPIFQIIPSIDAKVATAKVVFSPRFSTLHSVEISVPGLYEEPFLKTMCNGRSEDWAILKQVLHHSTYYSYEDIKTVSVVDLLPVIVRLHKEIKWNKELLAMVHEFRRKKVEELWFLNHYLYYGGLLSELRELGTVLESSDLHARVVYQLIL